MFKYVEVTMVKRSLHITFVMCTILNSFLVTEKHQPKQCQKKCH